jgi:hypothetical protein
MLRYSAHREHSGYRAKPSSAENDISTGREYAAAKGRYIAVLNIAFRRRTGNLNSLEKKY